MKKTGILAVSLIAIMTAGAARADLASTGYVDGAVEAEITKKKVGTITESDVPKYLNDTDNFPSMKAAIAIANAAANPLVDQRQEKSTANYQMGNEDGEWTTMSDAQQGALNSGVTSGTVSQVATNKSAIEDINDATTGILALAKADATTKANKALADAKSYTDTKTTNMQVTTNMATAETVVAADKGSTTKYTSVAAAEKIAKDAADDVAGDVTSLTTRVSTNESAIKTINDSAVMKSGVTTETVGQVATNKSDIAAIKTEQTTQNTDIKTVTDKVNAAGTGLDSKLPTATYTAQVGSTVTAEAMNTDAATVVGAIKEVSTAVKGLQTGENSVDKKIETATADMQIKSKISTAATVDMDKAGAEKDVKYTSVAAAEKLAGEAATAEVGKIDGTYTVTGNGVISSVTQTDGKITNVARRAIVDADIDANAKIAVNKLAMPAECKDSECALVYDTATKGPKWQVVVSSYTPTSGN